MTTCFKMNSQLLQMALQNSVHGALQGFVTFKHPLKLTINCYHVLKMLSEGISLQIYLK